MSNKTYDKKCYDLAEAWLEEDDELRPSVGKLAADIQCFLEDWVVMEKASRSSRPAPFDMADYANKVLSAVCGVPEGELKASVLSRPERCDPM